MRGRALQVQLDTQSPITRRLAAAYPDRLDGIAAAALTGAFVGAVTGALQVLLDGTEQPGRPGHACSTAIRRATDLALAPWLAASHTVTDDPRRH